MNSRDLLTPLLGDADARVRASQTLSRVAIITGVIWIPAGLVKFVFHHWELHAFVSFGLPFPSVLEIIAGVLETAGGVLLIMRRWVLPNAVLLAITMVVAIIASGIGHGDVIPSLTLAPALLIAMVWLAIGALPQRALQRGGEPVGRVQPGSRTT